MCTRRSAARSRPAGATAIAVAVAALGYFALSGTDHRSHAEQNAAIAAYVRRRNARAQPKVNVAVAHRSGPGRTDYPAKAA